MGEAGLLRSDSVNLSSSIIGLVSSRISLYMYYTIFHDPHFFTIMTIVIVDDTVAQDTTSGTD
jgi:hypothetical protein